MSILTPSRPRRLLAVLACAPGILAAALVLATLVLLAVHGHPEGLLAAVAGAAVPVVLWGAWHPIRVTHVVTRSAKASLLSRNSVRVGASGARAVAIGGDARVVVAGQVRDPTQVRDPLREARKAVLELKERVYTTRDLAKSAPKTAYLPVLLPQLDRTLLMLEDLTDILDSPLDQARLLSARHLASTIDYQLADMRKLTEGQKRRGPVSGVYLIAFIKAIEQASAIARNLDNYLNSADPHSRSD